MLNSNLARVICLAGVILGWVVFGMVMRPVANAPKVVLPRIETVVSPEKQNQYSAMVYHSQLQTSHTHMRYVCRTCKR